MAPTTNTTTTTTTSATEARELQAIHPSPSQAPHVSRTPWDDADGHTLTTPPPPPHPSNLRTATTVLQLASINLLSSFANGVITVGLPTIATSLSLPRSLYLWPLSVFGLTCGSTLLLAGSIADALGARRVELTGCFAMGLCVLACGLARTGVQLTVFRALQGVAMAVHLPASVAIVVGGTPKGKARNMAFAALGFARDIGYSVGLVLSGVLIETRGWRLNFYLAGGAMLVVAVVEVWGLPREKERERGTASAPAAQGVLRELWHKIDWAGSIIIGAGLALLAYVLA